MDLILKKFAKWCKAYMDVASANLQEYITDIRRLFQCLQAYNIKLEPKKAYIGFHQVSILGQRVDALGMSTPEEKLRAIADLQFPDTLQKLETYHTLVRTEDHHSRSARQHCYAVVP